MALNITQMVKNLPAMWETQSRSLGGEDPLEKGKATHSSILACRILVAKSWTRLSDSHFTSNGKRQLLGKCLWTFTQWGQSNGEHFWLARLVGLYKKTKRRDLPGGPEVENPPCNAADLSLIPGRGTRILPAVEKKPSYLGNCWDHVQQLKPDTVKNK